MTPVGVTALWAAAARALETERDRPLFADSFARPLAGEQGFQLLRQMGGHQHAHVDPYLSVRTRFFDDAMAAAVEKLRLTQVVLLAAGMDARAFRLSWRPDTVLYEVDRDDVFDWKEEVLRRQRAEPACERRIVRANLAGDWVPALLAAGFDAARPAAFLAEGLVMYLATDEVQNLMAAITRVAADGSWMGMDAASPELIACRLPSSTLPRLTDLGAGFQSAMAEPELVFAEHGWHAAVVWPGHPIAHFGRWPYPVMPAGTPVNPRAYFVLASRGPEFAPRLPVPVSAESVAPEAQGDDGESRKLLERGPVSVIQGQMPAGASGERRRCARSWQFFYVLSGQLVIDIEHTSHVVHAGSGLEIPPVVAYRVGNPGSQPASFLRIINGQPGDPRRI